VTREIKKKTFVNVEEKNDNDLMFTLLTTTRPTR